MLPVKRDMTCWQIASGRQDRGTYQISWERSCILKQLRSRQARSRTSPPFETNHVVMGYWAGWVTSAIFVHQFIAVRTSYGRRIVWHDDWSSPPSSDGSFYLAGCGNLQQKGSLPPSATRNHRADICPGDGGIISGDTLSLAYPCRPREIRQRDLDSVL